MHANGASAARLRAELAPSILDAGRMRAEGRPVRRHPGLPQRTLVHEASERNMDGLESAGLISNLRMQQSPGRTCVLVILNILVLFLFCFF